MGLWTDQEQRNGASYEWLHRPARSEAPAAPAPPPPEKPRRRWGILLAGAGLVGVLAALIVIAAVALIGKDDKTTETAVAPLAVSKGKPGDTRDKEIYKRVSASVLSIEIKTANSAGSGSGFVVSGNGTIVTNDHVVQDATDIRVRFNDHSQAVPAEVVGTDPSSDLAVIHVDPSKAPAPLKPLTFGDSSKVTVGDNALAIGFPLGLDRTATAGIISGLKRTIQAPNHFTIDNVIQTDAPINPGNSGGPLFDDRGRVIGVNAQIATAGSNGSVGIGFAIPSNTLRDVVPRLEKGQKIKRAYLGVSTSATSNGTAGALVGEITPGGPADKAGLRAADSVTGSGGDVITAINGKTVADPDGLTSVIGRLHPGDKATVTYLRNGRKQTTQVTLVQRPAQVAGSSQTSP